MRSPSSRDRPQIKSDVHLLYPFSTFVRKQNTSCVLIPGYTLEICHQWTDDKIFVYGQIAYQTGSTSTLARSQLGTDHILNQKCTFKKSLIGG